ncbi:hypothetical protein RYZ18_02390 [Roseovarius sp. 10]|jgi:hypothetical protein|uniref:hypothetical protein n=1 Tax=Roseovarius sp. 10 TaxID=3080563 RepID=UPI0019F6DD3E|nr:hypothetical protein [Roseovarius sp. 10]MBE1295489.1 hypothetical protein [Paracoccaceae bacterium]MDV7200169.1 hypothetical protein [Roseovarius sp. 10]
MFGLGKKDQSGKQVRIEHRGKYTRASRTGGVSVRAEKKLGPVNLTANSSKGLRVSTRVANGARVALQNGRFQFIGRWKAGPLGFNLSKTGVSASVKNHMGSFNFLKPQYSSFKFAGVQLRGKKAAQLQLIYIGAMAVGLAAMLAIRLVIFLLWMLSLPMLLLWDMAKGFAQGFRDR